MRLYIALVECGLAIGGIVVLGMIACDIVKLFSLGKSVSTISLF
jgi:hypothetical protein